jgi:hypothetical protein
MLVGDIMDRDVVNLLHYAYHEGHVDWNRTRIERRMWCALDTKPSAEPFLDGGRIPDQLFRFLKSIEDQMSNLPKPDFVLSLPFKAPPRQPGEPRPCFVAMPYSVPWFAAVSDVIEAAAKAKGFACEITKDLGSPGDIPDQVWQGIRSADVVVADITGNNPNVFYEVGLAHALGKEVIVLTQDEKDLPFDIRCHRKMPYKAGDLVGLASGLEAAFESVSARYPFEGREPRF